MFDISLVSAYIKYILIYKRTKIHIKNSKKVALFEVL